MDIDDVGQLLYTQAAEILRQVTIQLIVLAIGRRIWPRNASAPSDHGSRSRN